MNKAILKLNSTVFFPSIFIASLYTTGNNQNDYFLKIVHSAKNKNRSRNFFFFLLVSSLALVSSLPITLGEWWCELPYNKQNRAKGSNIDQTLSYSWEYTHIRRSLYRPAIDFLGFFLASIGFRFKPRLGVEVREY